MEVLVAVWPFVTGLLSLRVLGSCPLRLTKVLKLVNFWASIEKPNDHCRSDTSEAILSEDSMRPDCHRYPPSRMQFERKLDAWICPE